MAPSNGVPPSGAPTSLLPVSITPVDTREFDTGDCLPPDDNRGIGDVTSLAEDIERNGQLQAGLVCPHPTIPGKWLIAIGARRWEACKKVGRKFRADVLDRSLTPAEIIRCRFGENSKRQNMTAFEICDGITAYKRLMPPGSTWAEAGEELGIKPSTLNRMLAPKRIPPEIRPQMEGLGLTVVQIIGKLPKVEMMKQAIAFAQGDGKPEPKDKVQLFCKRLTKEGRGRGRRAKCLKGKFNDREFSVELKEKDGPDAISGFLKDLSEKVGKVGKEMPLEGIAWLFK